MMGFAEVSVGTVASVDFVVSAGVAGALSDWAIEFMVSRSPATSTP